LKLSAGSMMAAAPLVTSTRGTVKPDCSRTLVETRSRMEPAVAELFTMEFPLALLLAATLGDVEPAFVLLLVFSAGVPGDTWVSTGVPGETCVSCGVPGETWFCCGTPAGNVVTVVTGVVVTGTVVTGVVVTGVVVTGGLVTRVFGGKVSPVEPPEDGSPPSQRTGPETVQFAEPSPLPVARTAEGAAKTAAPKTMDAKNLRTLSFRFLSFGIKTNRRLAS
jgi:hypothetical protein